MVKEKEEPGVWGPDGLLAIPNVKMVLFLAGAVQVTTCWMGSRYKQNTPSSA